MGPEAQKPLFMDANLGEGAAKERQKEKQILATAFPDKPVEVLRRAADLTGVFLDRELRIVTPEAKPEQGSLLSS